jgi:hypothetical protein
MTGHEVYGPEPNAPSTLEVRWIRPGELDAPTLEWFGRFPAAAESREDDYLISPNLTGLSVKIRGGRALEVKVFRGRRGELSLAAGVRGLMESWQRWSFPVGSEIRGGPDSTSWRSVHKVRRISFFVAGEGRLSASVPTPERGTGCAVELTEVTMHGRNWWTLGLEAAGPPDGLRGLVEGTAALLFEQPLPGGLELTQADSSSYYGWLRDLTRRRWSHDADR